MAEADRSLIVAALESVDAVCLFDEDTPAELIAALLPDVLVKGADYTLDEVVGRDVVEASGGRVALIPLVEGRSTSGLVRRIKQEERE
jgi:rfaE bifunctional protein nucleotidyltransferase chain/domain